MFPCIAPLERNPCNGVMPVARSGNALHSSGVLCLCKAAIVSPAPAEWNVQIGLIGPRLDMVDCRYFQIS